MNRKIRLYCIDSAEDTKNDIAEILVDQSNIRLIGSTNSVKAAKEELRRIYADIVLLDESVEENSAEDSLPQMIQQLLLEFPYIGIIVTTTTEYNFTNFKRLANVGARDYLRKPFIKEDFLQSLQTVFAYLNELKESMVKSSKKILTRIPQMVTVFSTKGGIGKSTLTTLLAVGLATFYHEETVIIDLDLQFGDISLLFDVNTKKTITNILDKISQIDSNELRKLLVKHPTGVYLLPSPLNPEEADFVDEDSLQQIFQLLKEQFTYIIVDCPPAMTDQVIAALEQSDTILFVTSPELVPLKNTITGLKTIRELGIPMDKVKVVVNRFSKNYRLSVPMIEDLIKMPVYATISEDYEHIIQSINLGEPQLIYQSNTTISKDYKKLIEGLRTFHYIDKKKSKHRFWSFFKKKDKQ